MLIKTYNSFGDRSFNVRWASELGYAYWVSPVLSLWLLIFCGCRLVWSVSLCNRIPEKRY